MEEFLESLKEETLISHAEILLLRQQLQHQYPHFTEMQRAQLFAQAIQQDLDQILMPFEEKLRKKIKFHLLRHTVYREDFCINAFDVVHSYSEMDEVDAASIQPLTTWLRQYDHAPTSYEETCSLVTFLSHRPQETTAPHEPPLNQVKRPQRLILFTSLGAIILTASCFMVQQAFPVQHPEAFTNIQDPSIYCPVSLELQMRHNDLQKDLQYTPVNTEALKNWLDERNSLLSSEPYFSTILDTAREFNVNPLLLFAITGQEQSFVPRDHAFAKQMANNPFNLYGSWERYNTDIADAARIAARTVIHLGEGCPEGADQIQWINQSYAADDKWHLGVSYFFETLKEATLEEPVS